MTTALNRAIFYKKYGSVDVLEEGFCPEPAVEPGQVLVDVLDLGLNPLDYRMRRGEMYPLTIWKKKRLIASDFCGIVLKVGDRVSKYAVGDCVYGMVNQVVTGTSMDRIAVDQENLSHAPENISSHVAAGVPLAALTALQALRDLAAVRGGP